MKRRALLVGGAASATLAATRGLAQQPARTYRIGVLIPMVREAGEKYLVDLLTEIAPKMSRVALLSYAASAEDPGAQSAARAEEIARAAADGKGLTLLVVRVRDAESVREAFAELERMRPEAIVVAATAATYRLRDHITREARRLRLPSISSLPAEWAEAGGLVTYGPDWHKTYRYAATFVDRILKGANPAEIPIEQPENFEVVVNLKTAREIGVTIPPSILLRANRVIE